MFANDVPGNPELERLRAEFFDFLQNLPDALVEIDVDDVVVTFMNQAALELFGYAPGEEARLPGDGLFPQGDAGGPARLRAVLGRPPTTPGTQRVGGPAPASALLRRKDGSVFLAEIRGSMVHGPDGAPRRFRAIVRDATPSQEAEAARLQAVIDTVPDSIAILELDGRIRYANAAHRAVLGYEPEELRGRLATDWAHPDDVARALEALQRAATGEQGENVVVRVRHANGSTVLLEIDAGLLRDAAGRPVGLVTAGRDVTRQVREQEERVQREAQLQTIKDSSPDGIVVHDAEGRYLDVNPAMTAITGFSREELLTMRNVDLLTPDDALLSAARVADLKRLGSLRGERALRHKNGTVVPVEVSVALLPAGGFMATVRDISDRKLAEQALLESEQRFRAIVETSPDLISILDLEGRVVFANDAHHRVLGRPAAGLVGEIVVREDEAAAARSYEQRLMSGEPVGPVIYHVQHADGTWVELETSARLMRDAEGKVTGVLAVSRDVGERQQREQALRAANAFRDLVLGATSNGIAAFDSEGKLTLANERFREIFGLAGEAIDGAYWGELIDVKASAWSGRVGRELRSAPRTRGEVAVQVQRTGEQIVITYDVSALAHDGQVTGFVVTVEDVTERRAAEQKLQESEARYRETVDLSPGAIVLHQDGHVVYANRACGLILGARPGELRGASIWDFVPADERERITAALARGEGSPDAFVESRLMRLDGRLVDVEIASGPTTYEGRLATQTVFRDVTERRRAEEALRESEERFARTFAENPMAMAIFDPITRRCLDVNQSLEELLGFTKEELVGSTTVEMGIWLDENRREELYGLINAGGVTRNLDAQLRLRDGSVSDVLLSFTYVPSATEPQLIGTIVDVSALKAADRAIRASEERFARIFEENPVAMAIFQTEAPPRCVAINASYSALFGYAPEEVVGQTGLEEKLWVDPERRAELLRILRKERGVRDFEAQFYRKDGAVLDILASYTEIHSAEGHRALTSMVDITARKRAERALKESEERFAQTFHSSPMPLLVSRLSDGTLLDTNQATLDFLGREREDVVGRSVFQVNLWTDIADRERWLTLLRRDGSVQGFETQFTNGTGEARHVRVDASLVLRGGVPAVVGGFMDVTDRMRAEAAIRESEERFSQSFHASPVPMAIGRRHGWSYLDVNEAWEQNFGYRHDFAIGKTLADLGAWVDDSDWSSIYRGLMDTGQVRDFRLRMRRADGEVRETLVSVAIATLGAEEVFIASWWDVTELTQVQQNLRESEERFSRAFHSSPMPMAIGSFADGNYTDVNQRWVEVFGYSHEEMVGTAWRDLGLWVSEEQRRALSEPLRRDGVVHEVDIQLRRADGELRDVLASVALIELGGQPAFIASYLDVTDLRRAEEERAALDRKLLETQKLESLGVLAGGIAHDFNNLLVAIMGNASLAVMEIAEESPVLPYLQEIEVAAQRAADLARQMLAYSGKGRFVIAKFNLSKVAEEIGQLLSVTIPRKVKLDWQLQRDLPVAEGDATQLRQVVMNLVINASEAIGDGEGVIRIRTGRTRPSPEYLAGAYLAGDLPDREYVFLEVQDTGIGMDEETRNRIFDPFFTTKFTGRGLGMAAVLGIIRGHQGAIRVDSDPGKGTTIRVLLPVAEPGEASETAAKQPVSGWHGRGIVLVIDDEEPVTQVASRMLERLGFTTVLAADGHEGLSLLRDAGTEVVAALLDVSMPLGGEEGIQAFRAVRPNLPIVVMSGYADSEQRWAHGPEPGVAFLAKPFTFAELEAKLKSLLASE